MAGCCCDLLSRVPCATILAFLINLLALCLMAGLLIKAFGDFLQNLFDYDIATPIAVVFVVLLLCNVAFLIFAILSTGSTRATVFHKLSAIIVGECFQCVFIFFAFIINIVWVAASCLLTIPVVFMTLVTALCWTVDVATVTGCIVLADIGLIHVNKTYCGKEVEEFCEPVTTVTAYTIGSLVGGFLGTISMVMFLMAMAANYVHLKDQFKVEAMGTVAEDGSIEMTSRTNSKAAKMV